MRNLKKFLAVLVVVTMIASSFMTAFAADATTTAAATVSAEGKIAGDIGALAGEGNGVDATYLAKNATRLQAAIISLRLQGKLADALKQDLTAKTFADANLVSFENGKKVLAYLFNNPTLGWVGDGVSFGPNTPCTTQMIYKVMLESMGYTVGAGKDFEYKDTLTFAATKKLDAVADKAQLTNDDIAKVIVESLTTDTKTAGTTFAAKLVAAGVLDAAKATAAGVYTAAPAALAVDSATATNLKEIVVKFNRAISKDVAEKVGNYTIAKPSGTATSATGAALGADGMTVTLTIDPSQISTANNIDYTLVVKKDIGLAADVTKTVRVFDVAAPTVTGMTLTGPRTFDLTFSEPIKTAPTVKLANNIYGVAVGAAGTNKITVTISASSLTDGDYAVEVSGFKDYADFPGDVYKATLKYAKSTSPITATIEKQTQTSVNVVFNTAVKMADPTKANYFYQTFNTWKPTTVTPSSDRKTYTLEFTQYPFPAGTSNLVVKYNADGTDGDVVEDDWGNKMSADLIIPVTVTADVTAPTVTSTEVVDEDTVKLYFSEDVTGTAVDAVFTVKGSDGKAVTKAYTHVLTSTPADSKYYVTLEFTGGKLDGGNYTVDLKDITDKSLASNKIAPITIPFTITDKTAMTAASITATAIDGDKEILYVTFPEKVAITGQYSALNADNYYLYVTATTQGALSSTTLYNPTLEMFGTTGKVVKITIDNQANFSAAINSTLALTVGKIADLAGNVYATLSTSVGTVPAEAGPTISGVKLTDYNKIEFTINKPISSIVTDAIITTYAGINGKKLAAIDSVVTNADNTVTVKATIDGTFIDAIKVGTPNYTTQTALTLTSISLIGEYLVSETLQKAATTTAIQVADARAPVVLGVTTVNLGAVTTLGGIQFQYSEALDVANVGLFANDFKLVKVAADGTETTLTAGYDYVTVSTTTAGIAGDSVLLKGLGGATIPLAAGKYKVYTNATTSFIRDASVANNKATPYTTVKEFEFK